VTSDITPLVLTFNEAPNLDRTLAQLRWADEVVVLDSFSTDETLSIARKFANVRAVQRTFDTHVLQWNAGVAECRNDWVLSLDADYVLSPELVEELRAWRPPAEVDAYFCHFRYCIEGKPLRGSLYPPRAVLFRRSRCHYVQNGHTQLLRVSGKVSRLEHVIFHDDRKPLGRWLVNQDRYAKLEAEKLLSAPAGVLRWRDRLRRQIVLAPALVFFTTLLGKGVILDGWRGWFYTCQRTIAELMLSLRLAEARLQKVRRDE
jgi:glycosyltransferase involved in cell wall biosynthesis